ncbi:MAG: hypothetical protein ACI8UO_004236 [Verrucomicrobiales bacterium]|jgi:hypothetical protein
MFGNLHIALALLLIGVGIADDDWEDVLAERKQWWSLQPVAPASADQTIDEFIKASLEENGLTQAPAADWPILARRLTFSLTGLPPTQEQLALGGFEKLLQQLLGSPHFGERWARHWMDVVRYGDTYGYEWDVPAKGAWRYRDYLVRAFNDDVPFDQLVREQIAGDLLPEPRIDPDKHINESLIGVMFFQLGEKRHGDSAMFDGIHQEMLDNKIDAFSKAFQATTVACARCHDHKLDAVAQRDYYALGGVFMSSRWVTNTLDLPERNAAALTELRELKPKIGAEFRKLWLADLESITAEQLLGEAKPEALEEWLYPLANWEKWEELGEQYREEHRKRSEGFEVIADFRDGVPEGWSIDGVGIEVAPPGTFRLATSGETAVLGLHAGGLLTSSLSPKLNGALRTPFLAGFEKPMLSFEVSGGDFAAQRTIVDNAFVAERQKYLKTADPVWLTLSTFPEWADRHAYHEFATKTSNPNFPPRWGLGDRLSPEQIADPQSWFSVTRVISHDTGVARKDDLARFLPLFEGELPKSRLETAARYVEVARQAIETSENVAILNWMLAQQMLTNSAEHPLIQKYREIEQRIEPPQTVNGMADLDAGFDLRLNLRGVYNEFGDAVPRGFLSAFHEPFDSERSGRLELAELIASPENPLTARVFVNRVWHWLLGTGLVATPNDFGQLGEQPSHPELLDWLARRFVDEGWSTKWLIREIVSSETWRQTGEFKTEADPRNRLLHYFPTRRLEAEAIRDSILAVSGRLDPQLGGSPIDPFRANEDPMKRLFSGPLDGDGRRSIYTKVCIMEPPKFLEVFNQPKPKIPTGKREFASTPAQALTLLNDPFVHGQADFWAQQLLAADHESVEARMTAMFERAFGRRPDSEELIRWSAAAREFAEFHGGSDSVLGSALAWKDIAHALFNMKEFIYVR